MIIIKNEEQIEGIRKSCKLAAKTLEYLQPFVIEGIATAELDRLAEEYIRDHHGIPAPLGYMGYPNATCISVNEVICHGVPNNYKLKNGDIVNVDVSTILNGYYGDTATMYTVGEISEDARILLNVAKKCLDIGIAQIRPNNFFGNIGYEISRYASLQQCSVVVQFAGHGVGIFFHENPVICHVAEKNSGEKMEPGMVFTVEPMLCLGTSDAIIDEQDGWTVRTADDGLSAQYEHTILVLPDGHEILTNVSS